MLPCRAPTRFPAGDVLSGLLLRGARGGFASSAKGALPLWKPYQRVFDPLDSRFAMRGFDLPVRQRARGWVHPLQSRGTVYGINLQ